MILLSYFRKVYQRHVNIVWTSSRLWLLKFQNNEFHQVDLIISMWNSGRKKFKKCISNKIFDSLKKSPFLIQLHLLVELFLKLTAQTCQTNLPAFVLHFLVQRMPLRNPIRYLKLVHKIHLLLLKVSTKVIWFQIFASNHIR